MNVVLIWRTRGAGVIEPETIYHRRVMATNISRSLARIDGYGKEGKVGKKDPSLHSMSRKSAENPVTEHT